ncbi:MAG TPA: AIPR family protein [Bacteroidia bacterium]
MANINDFKLISAKSKKYFELLSKALEIDLTKYTGITQERYGFYLYLLESICGIKDLFDLTEIITDTEFNTSIFNAKYEDYGIDAIYIDEDAKKINLFNFKYREKFNSDKKQSINDTILSTKFINALINEDVSSLEGKLKANAEEIINKLVGKEIWKLNLYVISNEYFELNKNDDNLKQLENIYGLEIIPIGLSQISEMMSIRPNPVNAKIIIDKDAIMSYSESSISSSKSYIIRLSISELIRITSNNEEARNNYSIEDLKPISSLNLDFSVLFDNVRGLVLNSKFNPNISKSLKEEPSKFFMYNNGITITENDVQAEVVNAGKKIKLSINDFQVLNGGQTLRTIHNFNKEDKENIINYLANSEILVRVFKTISDKKLINKIAEYTNSQNSISNVDLKSLSTEQIQLEQYLDEKNIIYSRKNGDTGISNTKQYDHKISMERFGQILFSIKGFPEKASNQKKQIFDKYYDELFGENNLIINESDIQIKKYFEVKKAYEKNTRGYESSDQKVFYILYLNKYLTKETNELIELFENLISEYKPEKGKALAEARKLIQAKFKTFLDTKLKIA